MQFQVKISIDADFDVLSKDELTKYHISAIERQTRDIILNEGVQKYMIEEL